MKKIILGTGLVLGIGTGLMVGTNAEAMSQPPQTEKELYRVYNPNSGEHFFTENLDEYYWLTGQGWEPEDVAWNTPTEGEEVYRLYNPNAGDHFYTKSIVEYDWLNKQGWTQEGMSFLSSTDKTAPVYRSYNKNAVAAGAHMFTLSKIEHDGLVNSGWTNENVQFYAVSYGKHLGNLITYANSLVETDYDAAEYAQFKAVVTESQIVLNDVDATQDELKAQLTKLNTALEILEGNAPEVDPEDF